MLLSGVEMIKWEEEEATLFEFEVFGFVFEGGALAVDLMEAFLLAATKDWSDILFLSIFSLMVSTDGEAATAGGCTLGRRGCMLEFMLYNYAKGHVKKKKKRQEVLKEGI